MIKKFNNSLNIHVLQVHHHQELMTHKMDGRFKHQSMTTITQQQQQHLPV